MLKIYTDPNEAAETLLKRQTWEDVQLSLSLQKAIEDTFGQPLTAWEVVQRIVGEVRAKGDEAVKDFTKRLDKLDLQKPSVEKREMYGGYRRLSVELRESLELAALRIRGFHRWQLENAQKGFLARGLGQKVTPLRSVGIYVPGGTASYPSTVLMTAIPARVAGVSEVIVATPAGRDGRIADAVLAAGYLSGVDRIFKVGGAQAIAAMAFGTRSIPRVDKICGPGNIFVVLAKKMVFGQVGIDGLAGPTETVILADETANPVICAADLLAQAEHDVMASAILITDSALLAGEVQKEVEGQLSRLERKSIAGASLEQRGGVLVLKDLQAGIDLINSYAPEHVSLMVRYPRRWVKKIKNAGCIFVGEMSAETFGDYVAGPSHVLPTGGSARFSSALGVGEFLKVSGLVRLDEATVKRLAPAAARIADIEGLTAHARAARLRER